MQLVGGREGIRTPDPLLAKQRNKIYVVDPFGFVLRLSIWFWTYFGSYRTQVGPKFWGDPLEWHSFFGHSFRFRNSVFASLAG